MRPGIDITGKRFGRLKVVGIFGVDKSGHRLWKTVCDCGNERSASYYTLTAGISKSCGCLRVELSRARFTIHGCSNHGSNPEYRSWNCMKTRCLNPKRKSFKNYGGRGITVCKRWLHSFENFLKDMGPRPSPTHSIERIDVNGNYEPSNCKWGTDSEQANNKRNNKMFELNGKKRTIAQWADFYRIKPFTVYTRINFLKWPIEKAITTPIQKAKYG